MKRYFILLITFSVLFIKAQEIKKEIEVKQATIFLQGAKVFGSTNVSLQKGRNTVRIINLPNNLDENTYKINLEKNTTLMAITPINNFLKTDELSDGEKKLEDERKKLQRQVSLLNIQIKNLTGEQNIINDNLKISTHDKSTPQDQLIKLTEFYRKRMLEIDNQIFSLNEQKSIMDESIAKLTHQSAEEETHKNTNRKELLLEILAENDTNLNLGVSYIVSDAGWVPSYDLRAQSVKKPLEMVYKGKIYQKTGQDWKNVKLFVSTYRPSYNQDRPIMSPLYVAEYTAYNPQVEIAAGYKLKKEAAAVNAYQMREDIAIKPSQIPVATASDNQMNVMYELNYNQTILSQEKEQYVVLDKKQIEASYKYHTVPKLNNHVYLMAFVKNWQNLNLINGEANIYFEDNYIGKTSIASNYVKDEFPISLGVDDRITVKRIKLEDKTAQKAMNSNKWETESYQISIRNNTKESIELEVLDQLPISENSKIQVKAIETGGGIFDEKTGSILWNKTMGSGGSDKINFSYEVKYPKEMQIRYYNR
nr:mucoidy inhibitor MuiA family protein [uncultured Chryseobacterium sp.]